MLHFNHFETPREEVSNLATNQVQKIRDARGDAVKEQKAYDEYAKSMRDAGQKPKPLKDLRR